MGSNNKHADATGLIKEIYHDWQWDKDPDFINDVKTLDEEEFAIRFHHSVGRQIRNEYGFWKKDTDLYHWFISQNITHPDDMSHYVFVHLYRYAKKQIDGTVQV